ncbi:hypothetical protein PT974_04147 [Cladobotryum mycophilum]|uniref:Uncharacterized protein n=1 Tax=Cladobotryum mycophilum TaxID=491253 RepID=A0ABR0SVD6_9HYPO
MAPSSRAVRFLAASGTSSQGMLQLRLRVKPGASKTREGIRTVNDEDIELCVAAQARDGEANQAVVRVLSETLGIPKSKFHLSQGIKSRGKTILIQEVVGDGSAYASRVLELLSGKCWDLTYIQSTAFSIK